jgi:ribosomal protein S12
MRQNGVVSASSAASGQPHESPAVLGSNSSTPSSISSNGSRKPEPQPQHSNSSKRDDMCQLIVARDLFRALREDTDHDLCDLELLDQHGRGAVRAVRFVLAARSPVFRRMLYGTFREAKSGTVQLNYSASALAAVVHFCSFHTLPANFGTRSDHDGNSSSSSCEIQAYVELSQAADYLELDSLTKLANARVTALMVSDPAETVCFVLEHTTGHLMETALQMIETRPYDTLRNSGAVAHLSTSHLELVLGNNAVAAGECFLFKVLSDWYTHQVSRLEGGGGTDRAFAALIKETQDLCTRCIQLANIEPAFLLSTARDCPFVSHKALFDAVSNQALKASRDSVWRLECPRGFKRGQDRVDRVLVEGAGNSHCNGMYYVIHAAGNGTDLYSKREVASGQLYVYTLSRCPRNPLPTAIDTGDACCEGSAEPPCRGPYYECRIFCSKFLTHGAVQSLQTMQSTGTVNPQYQPILQILDLTPPKASNTMWVEGVEETVPTPIRKYYRARLSDGDQHMTATFSADFNDMIEKGDLKDNDVLQIQGFGVYDVHGYAGIHVSRAASVTSGAPHRFGDPQPIGQTLVPPRSIDSSATERSLPMAQGVQNLYSCRVPATIAAGASRYAPLQSLDSRAIPPNGWQIESHGIGPAPECVWLPARRIPKNPHPVSGDSIHSVLSLSTIGGMASRGTSPRSVTTTSATSVR